MKYTNWHNEEQAKHIEDIMISGMLESMSLTPMKREAFNGNLFNECRAMMGHEFNGQETTVYLNINPIKKLFDGGFQKEILVINKERLPVSGDGYFAVGHDYNNKKKQVAKVISAYTPEQARPNKYHSLAFLGEKSPLLNLDTLKKVDTYRKFYSESFAYSQMDVEEQEKLDAIVKKFIYSEKLCLENMDYWIDSIIPVEDMTEMFMQRSGISDILNGNAVTVDQKYADLLMHLFSYSRTNFYVVSKIGHNDEDMENIEFYNRLAGRIKTTIDACIKDEKLRQKKYVSFMDTIRQMNYGFEGARLLPLAIMEKFKGEKFDKIGKGDKLKEVVKYFRIPELISILNPTDKRQFLSRDLDI